MITAVFLKFLSENFFMQYILIFFFLLPKQLPDPPLYPTTHLLKTLCLSLSLKKNKQNLKKRPKAYKVKGKRGIHFVLANYSSSWGLTWSVVVTPSVLVTFLLLWWNTMTNSNLGSCDDYSWLSTWLHLKLTKTQVDGFTCKRFF